MSISFLHQSKLSNRQKIVNNSFSSHRFFAPEKFQEHILMLHQAKRSEATIPPILFQCLYLTFSPWQHSSLGSVNAVICFGWPDNRRFDTESSSSPTWLSPFQRLVFSTACSLFSKACFTVVVSSSKLFRGLVKKSKAPLCLNA